LNPINFDRLHLHPSVKYDDTMLALFTVVVAAGSLVALVAAAWFVLRAIQVHRQELVLRKRLLEQAQPLLYASRCATCGGTLSTWDGGLAPLPAGVHAIPEGNRRRFAVEYAAHRECLGCGHQFELYLWSDGDNWGFHEAAPRSPTP
jgi:predicted amidohydrolase